MRLCPLRHTPTWPNAHISPDQQTAICVCSGPLAPGPSRSIRVLVSLEASCISLDAPRYRTAFRLRCSRLCSHSFVLQLSCQGSYAAQKSRAKFTPRPHPTMALLGASLLWRAVGANGPMLAPTAHGMTARKAPARTLHRVRPQARLARSGIAWRRPRHGCGAAAVSRRCAPGRARTARRPHGREDSGPLTGNLVP